MSFWVRETIYIYIYMCESPPFLFYSTPYFLLPLLIWSGASPKIKKVSFSGSHSPSSCSSGTFTSLFCNEFRVSVVTILKSSSLGATEGIGKEWQFCCLNFRIFFSQILNISRANSEIIHLEWSVILFFKVLVFSSVFSSSVFPFGKCQANQEIIYMCFIFFPDVSIPFY